MIKKIGIALALVALLAAGYLGYQLFRTPEAASGPIEAIPLTVETPPQTSSDAAPAPELTSATPSPTTEAATEAPVSEPAVPDVPAEIVETQPAADPEATTAAAAEGEATTAGEAEAQPDSGGEAPAAPIIFEIVPSDSQARFLIDEVLRGDPITVVGTTDQVAGQFAVTPDDLSGSQVGPVQVNARTLATDNRFRDRAIKNWILQTDSYEFVTFTPTEITGLPATGAVGESYTFQINGNLTITNVTRPVTFEVTATATSETRLEALAATTILYAEFGLTIPDSPSVDTVADEVRLELEFVAEAI